MLITLLNNNPNKYSFGSAGNGTSQHISGELFKIMTRTQMQHIPYKGSGPMIPDLLAGTIQLSCENITTAYPQGRGGKLRALAVTSSKRSFVAPDVPRMAEAGLSGYDLSSWQAMYAPAGTPRQMVARLYEETIKVLRMPDKEARRTRPRRWRHVSRRAAGADALRHSTAGRGGAGIRRQGGLIGLTSHYDVASVLQQRQGKFRQQTAGARDSAQPHKA
jgi:tripartite-type tricarboxylate transporter receptor subunit TctC